MLLDRIYIDDIVILEKKVWNKFGDLYDKVFWNEENFLLPLPSKWDLSTLWVINNSVIGFSIAYKFKKSWGHISRGAVDPDYLGKNIGYEMFEHQKNIMMQKCSKITVDVRSSNKPANKLFLKLGFKQLKGADLVDYTIQRDRTKVDYLDNNPHYYVYQILVND
jgi:ribosomal protein S18 acetylase RimI-like enzyme